MKTTLWILFAVCLFSLAMFFSQSSKPVGKMEPLPWQIEVIDQAHVGVIGLVLNQTTLAELRDRFNNLEGLTLFEKPNGELSLEAYFGKVSIGPLQVRLIVRLLASAAELTQLKTKAINRVPANAEHFKWLLSDQDKRDQMQRVIIGLNLIPAYSGLEQSFFRQRFGEPDFIETLDENAVRWFYTTTGVSILIDDEGKELIEYQLPQHMKLPTL